MTASPNNITALDGAAKQLYKDSNFEELVYKTRPLLGLLPKFEGFGGRNMPIVWLYGNPQAVSSTFSTAQSYSTSSYVGKLLVSDPLLTRRKSYQVFTIDGETIDALSGDETSFVVAMKAIMDGAIRALSDELETALFRGQQGSIAQVTAVTGHASYYFTIDVDATPLFEVGMALVATATAETGALLSSGVVLLVNRVDRQNGYIYTTDTSGTAIDPTTATTGWGATFAANSFVFRAGDQIAAGSGSLKFSGLADWNPSSVTAGESFYGVDRSPDNRMWGVPYDGSLDQIEDALVDSISYACREGGDPSTVVINNKQYRKFVKQLGAKRQYMQMNAKSDDGIYANVSYKGVVVDGDHGPVNVIAANKCQVNIGWTLTESTLLLATLGPAVHFTEYDGLRILRQTSDDGVEGRLVARGNLANRAPIWSNRVTLPS
jgi:hypothetical protein